MRCDHFFFLESSARDNNLILVFFLSSWTVHVTKGSCGRHRDGVSSGGSQAGIESCAGLLSFASQAYRSGASHS